MKKYLLMWPLLALCLGFVACSDDDDNEKKTKTDDPTYVSVGSDLIFKQVYATGVADYYWRDGFYELVNNSDETVYLDGVILGIVDRGWGSGWEAVPSVWMESGEKRYPLASYTVYFPGNGTDYPLEAGKSVVIATSAINHTEAHPANAEAGDVASPVDLTGADWEIFCPNSASDTDNPDVKNMEIAYYTFGLDFMPAVSGQSLVLAKLPEGQKVADYCANQNNFAYAPGTSFPQMLMLDPAYVIDAINIVSAVSSERYRTVFEKDDAGQAFVNAGVDKGGEYIDAMYSGKALRRKVVSVKKGVAKFRDSNNSTEDFVTCDPVPGMTFTTSDYKK